MMIVFLAVTPFCKSLQVDAKSVSNWIQQANDGHVFENKPIKYNIKHTKVIGIRVTRTLMSDIMANGALSIDTLLSVNPSETFCSEEEDFEVCSEEVNSKKESIIIAVQQWQTIFKQTSVFCSGAPFQDDEEFNFIRNKQVKTRENADSEPHKEVQVRVKRLVFTGLAVIII